tara:strand:- start:24420 stop:25952 length:1533 start_codon:yes stop_codon:yes gene_type:complete
MPDPYLHFEDAGASGTWVPGPPWILGHRGAPREAPENTLASLRRALEIGVDGIEYDLRGNASHEPVLMHDEDLARTTDAKGPLAARGLPELFGVDAGSWFSRRFEGEPVPLLDEALDLLRPNGEAPFHMIEVKESGLIQNVAERLRGYEGRMEFRIASFLLDVVQEARDLGLPTMFLAEDATDDVLRLVRRERFDGIGVGPGGWRTDEWNNPWRGMERWAWSVDSPRDLLEVCRGGFTGFNTNEPHRALAARALVHLTPGDDNPWPVDVPAIEVIPEHLDEDTAARGQWFGRWDVEAHVRNPFAIPVEARCGAFVRSGAFEIDGLPAVFDLEPYEDRAVRFTLRGGARSPGADPLFAALLKWKGTAGPGSTDEMRSGGQLLFDMPLARYRATSADGLTRRLSLLTERAGDPFASINLRRIRGVLDLSIESAGGIEDPTIVVRLGGEVHRGSNRIRIAPPIYADRMPDGVPFSVAIEGHRKGEPVIRRWAGGLPEGLGHGIPGRLHLDLNA